MGKLFAIVLLASGCGGPAFGLDGGNEDMTAKLGDLAGVEGADGCDAFNQKGCQPGLKCAPVTVEGKTDGYDMCVPIPVNAQGEDQPCSLVAIQGGRITTDNCVAGTYCAAVGSQLRCRKLCYARKDCPADHACSALTPSPTTIMDPRRGEIPLQSCVAPETPACNPINQLGCNGNRCIFSRGDDVGRVLVCVEATGTLPAGSPCTASSLCAAGHICFSLGFCRKLCNRRDLSLGGCPAGESCLAFFGSGDYGRCEK
jgi:hypothetical protein